MRGYHFATVMLGEGSIILPGNWWRIASSPSQFGGPFFLREHILENVRTRVFPEKPSRMRSSFYCLTMEGAQSFSRTQPFPGLIYEVEPLDPKTASHFGYLHCLPPLNGVDPFELASMYWQGIPPSGLDGEFLMQECIQECPLRVLRQV